MSMKNSSDTIGNRTRDLPTYSAVPQSTAPPAACPRKIFMVNDNSSRSDLKQKSNFIRPMGGGTTWFCLKMEPKPPQNFTSHFIMATNTLHPNISHNRDKYSLTSRYRSDSCTTQRVQMDLHIINP